MDASQQSWDSGRNDGRTRATLVGQSVDSYGVDTRRLPDWRFPRTLLPFLNSKPRRSDLRHPHTSGARSSSSVLLKTLPAIETSPAII